MVKPGRRQVLRPHRYYEPIPVIPLFFYSFILIFASDNYNKRESASEQHHEPMPFSSLFCSFITVIWFDNCNESESVN